MPELAIALPHTLPVFLRHGGGSFARPQLLWKEDAPRQRCMADMVFAIRLVGGMSLSIGALSPAHSARSAAHDEFECLSV